MFNRLFGGVLLTMLSIPAMADYESSYNLPIGVTPVSRDVHSLHMLSFGVCVAIAVVVFGVMIYSIATFRKSKGAIPDKTLTHSTTVEIIWTVIPVVILIAMAIPAARTVLMIEDTRQSDMTIKVTGYQWKWQYDYLGKNVSFYSTLDDASNEARQLNSGIDPNSVKNYLLNVDHPMVVPVNTKVRLLLTGNDVIHSWWVPDFGLKKDAIPGFVNEAWFKEEKIGTYTGQCTELCGRDHGFMPIVVEVKSKEDFDAWLAKQQGSKDAAPLNADQPKAAVATTAQL